MPAPATNRVPATEETTEDVRVRKFYRCVVLKTAPFEHKTFGGKGFSTENFTIEKDADGETRSVPHRGAINEFFVGGPKCELERVRAAIARKVVRWQSRTAKRGSVHSKRVIVTTPHPTDPFGAPSVVERPNHAYYPDPDDEPLSRYVAIEEVVPEAQPKTVEVT